MFCIFNHVASQILLHHHTEDKLLTWGIRASRKTCFLLLRHWDFFLQTLLETLS